MGFLLFLYVKVLYNGGLGYIGVVVGGMEVPSLRSLMQDRLIFCKDFRENSFGQAPLYFLDDYVIQFMLMLGSLLVHGTQADYLFSYVVL